MTAVPAGDQCALIGGTQTISHHCCAIGFSDLSGLSSQLTRTAAAACPLTHNVPTWAVRRIARYAMYKTCQTLRSVLLSHLLLEVLSWCVLGWLYRLALLNVVPGPTHKAAAASQLSRVRALGMLDSKTPKCTLSCT